MVLHQGEFQIQLHYIAGKKEGKSTTYYSSGDLYVEEGYSDDKLQEGKITFFYPDGTKKEEGMYITQWGKHGEWRQWAQDGKQSTVIYQNGRRLNKHVGSMSFREARSKWQ